MSPDQWLSTVRSLERRGQMLQAYDAANRGLLENPGHRTLTFRSILCLARTGSIETARRQLLSLPPEIRADDQFVALEARLLKDQAVAMTGSERSRLLELAAARYTAVFARSQDYYPGINAATLSLLSGDVEAAHAIAAQVLQLIDDDRAGRSSASRLVDENDEYYREVTRAEALLVLRQQSAAADSLRKAVELTGSDLSARTATRRQLLLICREYAVDPSSSVDTQKRPYVDT
jgi:adenylate cyclase